MRPVGLQCAKNKNSTYHPLFSSRSIKLFFKLTIAFEFSRRSNSLLRIADCVMEITGFAIARDIAFDVLAADSDSE